VFASTGDAIEQGDLMSDKKTTKQYLGDSVYAEFTGYEIVLTTENGLPHDPSNKIVLEPVVLEALFRYVVYHIGKSHEQSR